MKTPFSQPFKVAPATSRGWVKQAHANLFIKRYVKAVLQRASFRRRCIVFVSALPAPDVKKLRVPFESWLRK